jgi:hypothetical protein
MNALTDTMKAATFTELMALGVCSLFGAGLYPRLPDYKPVKLPYPPETLEFDALKRSTAMLNEQAEKAAGQIHAEYLNAIGGAVDEA